MSTTQTVTETKENMVRKSSQDEDIPWTQYLSKTPRTRNSSLASIASFASADSISSMASKVSNFWRPSNDTRDEQQRRMSLPVSTAEVAQVKKYRHVPMHAAADHFKTTTTTAVRKASIAPSSGMSTAPSSLHSVQEVPSPQP